ncbi:MAG TPA: hypothetical protein VFG04_10755, partial [Planctomycetaceae bacterium]|nr:hypothetical protein [Planctomycetaceae bacterium]
ASAKSTPIKSPAAKSATASEPAKTTTAESPPTVEPAETTATTTKATAEATGEGLVVNRFRHQAEKSESKAIGQSIHGCALIRFSVYLKLFCLLAGSDSPTG